MPHAVAARYFQIDAGTGLFRLSNAGFVYLCAAFFGYNRG
jgi:hypothetical protein